MIIRLPQPLFTEEMMHTSPLRYASPQSLRMRVRNPYRVITPTAQSPGNHTLHVKDFLLPHPFEDTIPQPIRTAWVFRISRTVRRAGYLSNHNAPPSTHELVASLRVIRPVSIKPRNEQHRRHRLHRAGSDRHADIDGDMLALLLRAERMRDQLFSERIDPVGRCFEIGSLLSFPGLVFDGGIHDREAGDAVESCDAEVEGGGFGVVFRGGLGLGAGKEGIAGGEECGGVGIRVGVVNVVLEIDGISEENIGREERDIPRSGIGTLAQSPRACRRGKGRRQWSKEISISSPIVL